MVNTANRSFTILVCILGLGTSLAVQPGMPSTQQCSESFAIMDRLRTPFMNPNQSCEFHRSTKDSKVLMKAIAMSGGSISSPPSFFTLASSDGTPLESLKVASVVGTVLTAINQGDVFIRAFKGQGKLPPPWKIALTYSVPFCVATYGAVKAKKKFLLGKDS